MGAPKNDVGLYEPRTPSDRAPDRTIDRAEAHRLVESGAADWINRGRAIRMVNPSSRVRCGSAETCEWWVNEAIAARQRSAVAPEGPF